MQTATADTHELFRGHGARHILPEPGAVFSLPSAAARLVAG
ncbi:hypothetical protein ACFVXW_17000 [Streptomyces sp. NPDC058251]